MIYLQEFLGVVSTATLDNDSPSIVLGLFVFLGVIYMTDKTFKTYVEQRALLIERGMLVEHPRSFTTAMQYDDYYNIINGYKKYFIATMSPETYFHGTTFEQVYALYNFDQRLRDLFLAALLRVEKNIKSIIAYNFSETYGHDHRLYLTSSSFRCDTPPNASAAQTVIGNVYKDIQHYSKQGHTAICHYLHKYKYIPFWVLSNILSFGRISHFFCALKLADQQKIALHFHLSAADMRGFLYFLNDFRNTCAHGDRIYTTNRHKRFLKFIPDTQIHKDLDIPLNQSNNYLYGKSDVLAMLIALKIFLPKSEFSTLKKRIYRLEKKTLNIIPDTIRENIDKEMGYIHANLNKL